MTECGCSSSRDQRRIGVSKLDDGDDETADREWVFARVPEMKMDEGENYQVEANLLAQN